ncbi:MAG: family 20 glycosylhydrolase [Lewinellaceae bacterium]|nr:family 20 glycosylhydrolase [Lewinellaceae bacterium]
MAKFRFIHFLFLLPVLGQAQTPVPQIIPAPIVVQQEPGVFHYNERVKLYYPIDQPNWKAVAEYFQDVASTATGIRIEGVEYGQALKKMGSHAIHLLHDGSIKGQEAYHMEIRESYVSIRASTPAGAFYAIQSLRQLFPVEFFSRQVQDERVWTIPCCIIDDAPRFEYRGMHLDVGRHFFPVSFIKQYIDLLAMHKMNRFHWHLTEDQGWRIEIKKYPKLQTIAACRKETLIGHYGDQPQQFDGKEYCGFYTQEEIKEVVAYAQQRYVTIVPEIEMPGHSLAALTAYPELGCTGGPYETATLWGVFDDVFCAGNEQTFTFIDNVLKEVCALFPGQYIHIGGDECPKTRWHNCPKCQARMKTEGLKDEHELQSYFIGRVEKILDKYDKKLIGWDEILEGGLAPSATVMSWRGTDGGIAAAQAGHDAIMTPGSHCYFDHYQSDPATEPTAIGGYTTVEKVYGYEPIPAVLKPAEAKHILGAQGNVWTEYMETPDYVEYMAFPRAIALAEVVWSPRASRDWDYFAYRLKTDFKRLDAMGVNYGRGFFDVKMAYTDGKVSLRAIDPSLSIRYTLDGSEPSTSSALYDGPIPLVASATLKATSFSGDEKMGKTAQETYTFHKASGKPYTMSTQPEQYTGGETYALTNGVSGNLKTWGKWVGLVGKDIDPVIDLGAETHIESVSTHFVNAKASWIYPPRSIEVLVSEDGKKFRSVGRQDFDADAMSGRTMEQVQIKTARARGRYLKVLVQNYGEIPSGMPGEGNGAWLFIDEIVVE